jgi:hypothetical protein
MKNVLIRVGQLSLIAVFDEDAWTVYDAGKILHRLSQLSFDTIASVDDVLRRVKDGLLTVRHLLGR